MTKSDLARSVSVNYNVSFGDAEQIVAAFFDALADALAEGRRIELRGFGTFEVREYDGYMGRNPRTGEQVAVPPKRMPFFKVGKGMKEAVNDV